MSVKKKKDNPLPDEVYEEEMYEYFIATCRDELLAILKSPMVSNNVVQYYPLPIDFNNCIGECPKSMNRLAWYSDHILELGDNAAFRAICDLYETVKDDKVESKERKAPPQPTVKKVHVRIFNMPVDIFGQYKTIFPGCEENGTFMTIKATVAKTTGWLTLDTHRVYKCSKCRQETTLASKRHHFDDLPKFMSNGCKNECKGGRLEMVVDQKTDINQQKKYQEIRVQEKTKGSFKAMPKSMWVILEDDLVECCKAGDDVLITGILFLRCRVPFRPGQHIQSELAFKANHVLVRNDMRMFVNLNENVVSQFESFWKQNQNNPFKARNIILKSFCPEIYGMYLVKLALVAVLTGGVSKTEAGSNVRGEAHLLLVGDPGTGKSQLIKYCSKLMPRSVFTTGVGTTNAGLTVAAVKENGQWTLEAGALVMADGGVCCIDEFSTIKEHDRIAIHEAMEQQTISIAKAGQVSSLRTQCTIIAATNPKFSNYDTDEGIDMNVGLPSPMLSRFDLIIVLKDTHSREWDELLCDFILSDTNVFENATRKAIEAGKIWDTDTLRAYMVHIRGKDPEMTDDAIEILQNYYNAQRQSRNRNPGRTTVRLYESLYRLAEAHARLMYRSEVRIHDAIVAVSLIEASMQSSAIIGQLPNSLHIAFPEDPFKEYESQAKLVLDQLHLSGIWEKEKAYLDSLKKNQSEDYVFPTPAPRPPPATARAGPGSLPQKSQSAVRPEAKVNDASQESPFFASKPTPGTSATQPKTNFNLGKDFNHDEFFREDDSENEGEIQCSCSIGATSTQVPNPPQGKNKVEAEGLSPIRGGDGDGEGLRNVLCTPQRHSPSANDTPRKTSAEGSDSLPFLPPPGTKRKRVSIDNDSKKNEVHGDESEMEVIGSVPPAIAATSVTDDTGEGDDKPDAVAEPLVPTTSFRLNLDRFRKVED